LILFYNLYHIIFLELAFLERHIDKINLVQEINAFSLIFIII